ncbi:MAG: PD-(D/E)XK nuclease family protein [Candidatus Obscuribacterales bacterium]|nr:PD-(D/E)XK nuclease family protein [Candidatus Obscuribacterales bacterium]
MRKSLSFSDLWIFLECPQEFLARLRRKKTKKIKQQVVGDATHAIAEKGEVTEEIKLKIEKEVALLPEEEREETRKRIEQVTANALEMAEEDGDDDEDTNRESVYRWLYEAIGWTLCAKPDKVEIVTVDGRQVLDIMDFKSGSSNEFHDERSGKTSYRAKRKHKDQLFFFAMVVSKAMGWTGPVRMRIRYWGNKADCEPMWYSHRRTDEQLREVTAHIRKIEAYFEAQSFPTRPGFWCKDCPLAESCEGNRDYQDRIRRPATVPLQQLQVVQPPQALLGATA